MDENKVVIRFSETILPTTLHGTYHVHKVPSPEETRHHSKRSLRLSKARLPTAGTEEVTASEWMLHIRCLDAHEDNGQVTEVRWLCSW